jgi:hypothetical protein
LTNDWTAFEDWVIDKENRRKRRSMHGIWHICESSVNAKEPYIIIPTSKGKCVGCHTRIPLRIRKQVAAYRRKKQFKFAVDLVQHTGAL